MAGVLKLKTQMDDDISSGVSHFKGAIVISCLYLFIPFDKLLREYFMIKTKRNPSKKDVTFVIDILLFASVVMILAYYTELMIPDNTNPFNSMFADPVEGGKA